MQFDEQTASEPPVTELTRRIMRRVASRDTTPELAVRAALHAAGLRFRLHDRQLPGTPDIVLARWRTVILVHGCFWHRHEGCRYASAPKTRAAFWSAKFARNVERDMANRRALEAQNWRVVEVWECEVKRGSFQEPLIALFRPETLSKPFPSGRNPNRIATKEAHHLRSGTR